MRSSFVHAALAATLVTFAAPAMSWAEDAAVASIGNQPVTAADLKGFVEGLNPQQRAQAAQDPKISAQIVRSAIGQKLLLEDAEKAGWEKKPEVEEALARAREQVLLQTYLGSVSAPPKDFPSEQDIRAAYDANRNHLFQYHLAQIFIAEQPGWNKEQVEAAAKKAADLAKKAKAKGADFAALARANSEDPTSATKGGDLGWLAQNQLLPEMVGAIMALGEKGVTDPVLAAGGWHILALTGVKPADFDQVKDQIANALRESRIQQNQQAYVQKLLDDHHVTVNETAAAALFTEKK